MNPPRLFRISARTPKQKADLAGSWARPDEDFFAAGACHILAGAFLETYPHAGFHALMLQPVEGFRGGHVVVANGSRVFDCRGWHEREDFLLLYTENCRALYPGWSCTLTVIPDPLGWDFCRAHTHRHPSQFFRDPLPRAKAFLRTYPAPP